MNLKEAKDFTNWLVLKLAIIYLLTVVIALIISLTDYGRDSSDEKDGKRSGLKIRTDYLTMCQYFETSKGGIIARTDKDGNHVGCEY